MKEWDGDDMTGLDILLCCMIINCPIGLYVWGMMVERRGTLFSAFQSMLIVHMWPIALLQVAYAKFKDAYEKNVVSVYYDETQLVCNIEKLIDEGYFDSKFPLSKAKTYLEETRSAIEILDTKVIYYRKIGQKRKAKYGKRLLKDLKAQEFFLEQRSVYLPK